MAFFFFLLSWKIIGQKKVNCITVSDVRDSNVLCKVQTSIPVLYSSSLRCIQVYYLFFVVYTAVSRKVVGKSARDNPERHCGWFLVHCFSKKFQRMAREAMGVCLRGLKETTKVGSTATVSRTSVLILSHITFRDCCVHSFCDNLSRNSCIRKTSPLYCNEMHGKELCVRHQTSYFVWFEREETHHSSYKRGPI